MSMSTHRPVSVWVCYPPQSHYLRLLYKHGMGATSHWCPVKNEPQRGPESHRKKGSKERNERESPTLAFVVGVWLTALSLAFRATTPNHTLKPGVPVFSIFLLFLSISSYSFLFSLFSFYLINFPLFIPTFFFLLVPFVSLYHLIFFFAASLLLSCVMPLSVVEEAFRSFT